MKVKIILLFMSVFISCSRNSESKIILTTGLSSDPSDLRFGIEITEDEVFYCQETKPQSETYNYYSTKIKPDVYNKIINDLSKSFLKKIESFPCKDGQSIELQFTINKDLRKYLFDLDLLDDNQMTIIREIINLKELKMEKIEYHTFPDSLLKERLPVPPAFPKVP